MLGEQGNLIVKHRERQEEVNGNKEHVGWKLKSCVTDRCGELSHQLEEEEEDERVEEEEKEERLEEK